MPSSDPSRDVVLERLAAEFVERHRRGECPPLSEYTDRHPELAGDIRELFPALVQIEKLKPETDLTGDSQRAETSSDARALERLGEYRILRLIGRGGMGVVYEAEQESLGRYVALKVLPSSALLHPTYLERFKREAKAAARLHHTNIVPVFGVGEHDGIPYYAMQFIRGEGLDRVLADVRRLRQQPGEAPATPLSEGSVAHSLLTGRFASPPAADPGEPAKRSEPSSATSGLSTGGPEAEYYRGVARIGVQVAEALAYAHRQGILHRDIKPSNLLLDLQGTVWITDFGLAKAEGTDELTQVGEIVGTLRFMAPERFEGKSLPQSDVYALGLTLYELLTLRTAFDDTNKAKLIEKVVLQPPEPPRRIDPRIPRDLETIVLKCLAKEATGRYATAEALAEDLQRFLADRPIKARPVGKLERTARWAKRNPAIAALVLVSGLALLGLVGAGVGYHYNERLRSAYSSETESRERAEEAQLVAEQQRQQAHLARGEAETALRQAQAYTYFHRIALADVALRDNNLKRTETLLDECPHEQRHWEWYYLKQQCHTDLLTIETGHAGGARDVAISSDGKLLASAGFDGGVALWEAESGRKIWSRSGHQGPCSAVAFSPDRQPRETHQSSPELLRGG
jgi:serine/threonine protein kinase